MRFLLLIFLFVIIQGIYCQNCSRTIQQSNVCAKSCNPTRNECKGSRDCVCDGDCGFSCVKRGMTCPKPRNIDNGRVIYKTTTLGSALTYRCNNPYKLVGPKRRSCRGKRKWDGQEPFCKITCKDPGDIQHGTRMYDGFDLGMKVTYDCLPGFTMQGRATMTCKETGAWDNARPSCVCERTNALPIKHCKSSCDPENVTCRGNKHCVCDGDCGYSCVPKSLDCGQPPSLRNGRRRFSSTTLGSIARYQCDKPYTLLGLAIRKCRGNGKWDDKKTKCKLLCTDPGDIMFGTKQVLGLELNEKVLYTCYPLYKMKGEEMLTCKETGQWDYAKPECILPQCRTPRIPSNAFLVGTEKSSYRYGERIWFQCKPGYYAGGFSTQKCSLDGWSRSSFICSPKSCGDPGNPRNGKVTSYKFTFPNKVTFQCDYGFKLNGDQYRLCQANQMWSGETPTCEPIDCGKLPTPKNAEEIDTGTGTRVGATVRFRCKPKGYEIHGSDIRTCQNDGTWSGVASSCKIVSCGDPGTPANGEQIAVKGNYSYGSSVEFKCNANYTMSGSARLYCEESKDWSASIPRCWAPCTDPGLPINGNRIGSDFRHDKSVTFSCHKDLILHGKKSIRCRDGRWSADKPRCQEIKCKDPGRPAHGRQAEVIKNYSYRGTVRFECSKNYTLSGWAVIHCMKNKHWNSSVPTCLAPCVDPGVPANGYITGDDFRHGNSVAFRCHKDFFLKGDKTISCQNGIWSADRPSCEGCVHGFPLGMKDGRIKDSSITASSIKDVFHAAHYGRLGTNVYWCSATEQRSYLEIHLPKRYKITAIDVQFLHKDGIRLLEFHSKYFHKWTPFYSDFVQSEQPTTRFSPLIAQSLRVVVERDVSPFNFVCLGAEVYGCKPPTDCIIRGSMVVGKISNRYTRAYVRTIRDDRFDVIPEGESDVYPILQREGVVVDEVPSASQLTYGAMVLGVDISSGQIREGKLRQKDNSLWQIETSTETSTLTSTWKSQEKDIRVIKESNYCSAERK